MKTSNARLTDQLSHARNDAKQIQVTIIFGTVFLFHSFFDSYLRQTRFEQELALVKQQLNEKEKELTSSERQLIDLRTRLSTMQAQYTAQESTIGKLFITRKDVGLAEMLVF